MSDPSPNTPATAQGDGNAPRPAGREPIFKRMPYGVATVIIAILICHLLSSLAGQIGGSEWFSTWPVVPKDVLGQLERGDVLGALVPLIGSQFLHAGNLHLLMNLALLSQAGPIAELGFGRSKMASVQFVLFFLVCGIVANLTFCWFNPDSTQQCIGASGAISGVFVGFLWAAIGLSRQNQKILRPVIVSGIVFLLINVGLAWVGRTSGFIVIAWESHLGGFIAGIFVYPIIARLGRARASQNP